MDDQAFAQRTGSSTASHARFASLLARTAAQRHREQDLRGLPVTRAERRHAAAIAETVGGVSPRAVQRRLTDAPRDHAPVIATPQAFLGSRLADPAGAWVVDDAGFANQERHAVGVARRERGALGAVGNCQICVGLSAVGRRGHALVGVRGVPATVTCQSKTDIVRAMLRDAQPRAHLPGRWVTADDGYGQVRTFRAALAADGCWYVVEMPRTTMVLRTAVTPAVPTGRGRGRRPTRLRLPPDAAPSVMVEPVAQERACSAWQTLSVAEGAHGPRTSKLAALRVWECRGGLPGVACWLLVRSVDGSELRCSLSNAPETTGRPTLGRVGATRWCIETDIQTTNGEIGLDDCPVVHHRVLAGGRVPGAGAAGLGDNDAGDRAPPDRPRAARGAPQPGVDRGRPAGVARGRPDAHRPRRTVPYEAAGRARRRVRASLSLEASL
jgi:SRSO17 transposase